MPISAATEGSGAAATPSPAGLGRDGCASYEAFYAGLAELDADTRLHVHKENNIVFPPIQQQLAAPDRARRRQDATTTCRQPMPSGHARSMSSTALADVEGRSMETLTDAMARLRADGYRTDFSATSDGRFRCGACGVREDPEAMAVHATIRFEGDSNPDDEAILLALACAGGCLGQYSAAFGPDTPAEDAEVLRRLARR